MDEDYWESRFAQQFQKIEGKQKPGAILSLIPGRDEWQEFIESVRAQWRYYDSWIEEQHYSLVVLFGGTAFYEYQENRFWPYLAEQIGNSCYAPRETGASLTIS